MNLSLAVNKVCVTIRGGEGVWGGDLIRQVVNKLSVTPQAPHTIQTSASDVEMFQAEGCTPRTGGLSVLACQEKHLSFGPLLPTAAWTLGTPGQSTEGCQDGPHSPSLWPPSASPHCQPEQLLFLKMRIKCHYSTHTSEGSRTLKEISLWQLEAHNLIFIHSVHLCGQMLLPV